MSRKQRRAEKSISRSQKTGSSHIIKLTLDKAVQYHQAGKLVEAANLYKQILDIDPQHADCLHLFGTLACQLGHHEAGIDLIKQAIQLKGNTFLYHFNLGTIFKQQNRLDEAVACYKAAISIDPSNAEVHRNLGSVLNDQGKHDDAISHFRQCLKLDPQDRYGVRLVLAGMGADKMPEKASETYLHDLYDARADHWDKGSASSNGYRGHELIAEVFEQLCKGVEKFDILDAGCGTGLVGALLRNRASRLDGIDISSEMLKKTKEKGIYDQLHQGDLVNFMESSPEKYDVITSAATLIHFGDLNPVFHAAATALRNLGLFIFTIFPSHDDTDVAVAPTNFAEGGCYVHGRSYINRLAEENCFTVEHIDIAVHEYFKGQAINCLVVALRRCSR